MYDGRERKKMPLKIRCYLLTTTVWILLTSCATKDFFKVPELRLSQLPEIGTIIKKPPKSRTLIMTSSASTDPEYQMKINAINYSVALNAVGKVKYIATDDVSFSTPEGLKMGDSYSKVKEITQKNCVKESGWGYYIKLSSGWYAGFCEGKTCTSEPLTETSTIDWFFKR
ncbi:MAG TPA: hypothetical protein PKJ37_06400 [Acidobacteriota bacterium]|nr:hypothetical protein [Acidobacteriota bacterium]HNT17504.1 hypothetical protein [Acidobacteriota bacterium]